MIVCHSFFEKKHPKYLDEAIDMMLSVSNSCFIRHDDFFAWVLELRRILKETTGGRFEKKEIQLSITVGRIQINIKNGQDYVARMDYISIRYGYARRYSDGKFVRPFKFHSNGGLSFESI